MFQSKIIVLFSIVFLSFCSCTKSYENEPNYLLRVLSPEKTGIYFNNSLTEDEAHSIINYIYFYNGGGVSVGDINNDGLPDIYFVANQGYNKLYLNKGNLNFEDVTTTTNVGGSSDWSTGSTMIDINNDGYLDIYVCAVSGLLDFKGHNELFINNGDGTFSEKSAEYGLDFKGYSTQSYFFDYDKDGDLDVYIVNHAVHTNLSHGPVTERNNRKPLVGDVLLQNNEGNFTDVSEKAGIFGGVNGYGLSASIADFNNDGWDDIYVCNDFHEDDYYYINNKNGTFTEKLSSAFSTISRFSMGSDVSDINGDGFQDLITLDMLPKDERVLKETEGDDVMLNMQIHLKNLGYKDQYSRNVLQINVDGDFFYETAFLNGIAATDWSWSPLFADYNNDSHQDLFISNGILRRPNDLDFKNYVSNTFKRYGQAKGLEWLYRSIDQMPSGKVSNQIFSGNSNRFSEKTGSWMVKNPSLSNGAVYVDLDLDGDLDVITNNVNDIATIYENTTNASKNYITIQLQYLRENKESIGSKTTLYFNNNKQFKQVFKSRGFLSSVESKLHFGLDTITKIDSIEIIWPNQKRQVEKNLTINKLHKIEYKPNIDAGVIDVKTSKENLFTKENLIDFIHKEDSYNDFFAEKLTPYKVSTLGPALAIGDVDKNGFEDVYIGAASGKPSELYLNTGTKFIKSSQKAFEIDAEFEDNDAVFFDANGDGDLDLYIASGIHSQRNKNFEIDRLYINSNGKFTKSSEQILTNPLNTSCVAAYDYDGDGDEDLFVGNLSNPDNFGAFVNSTILKNNGKGVFEADKNFIIPGKITDAVWIDINNDSQKDLLIASEWDVPKIYINNKGKLTLQKIPENLYGFWQSITTFDMDEDGDLDIVLGNWGENNKFQQFLEKPIIMYYGDLDANGKQEALISYAIGNQYFPMNSKSELASQMNFINKKFVTHKDFAMQSMEKIFSKEVLDKAQQRKIHTLTSGYLENNNGKFDTFVKLPIAFQLAPINSFSEITIQDKKYLLISGNSEKTSNYQGNYNSLKGIIATSKNDYKFVNQFGITPFKKQINETSFIKMKDKNVLLVLANNDSVKTYTLKN
jgi:enediyne biosynthesis protein E4